MRAEMQMRLLHSGTTPLAPFGLRCGPIEDIIAREVMPFPPALSCSPRYKIPEYAIEDTLFCQVP